MKQLQFYKLISKNDNPIFTSSDISRLIDKSPTYTKAFMTRVRKNNLLQLIEKGKYCKPDTPEPEVASHLISPSYISFLSALSFYGFTDQIPVEIGLVSLRQKASLNFNNYRIKFTKFSKKLFFGYSKQGKMIIADPEKAIIDSLYLINTVPLNEIVKILNENDLNIKKMIDYSLKMDSYILLKRLGYILEILNFPENKLLISKINTQRYDILNPSLPIIDKKNSKWHLIINEDLLC